MTPAETLQQHLLLCDEFYQLALEENRFLKQQRRVPESEFLERKKKLLERLDQSLAHLKALNLSLDPSVVNERVDKTLVERVRAKVMQVLHLDRENEQLLFRYSLGGAPRPNPTPPPPSRVQRLYERLS